MRLRYTGQNMIESVEAVKVSGVSHLIGGLFEINGNVPPIMARSRKPPELDPKVRCASEPCKILTAA